MTLSALAHLHGSGWVHRDVKPENLRVDSDGYIKLVDLGLACRAHVDARRAWTLCGTPEYTAPEVFTLRGHGREVDLWAVGVLLFEMLAGFPPFCDDEPIKVYALAMRAEFEPPTHVPADAKDLIAQLLRPRPIDRLGAARAGAVDVACHRFFGAVGGWPGLLSRQTVAPIIPVVNGAEPIDLAAIEAMRAATDAANAEAEPAHASLGALLRDSFVEMDAEQFESSARDDDADEHGE